MSQKKGYRTRDILTRALLQLEELDSIHGVMDELAKQLQDLRRKLDRLSIQDVKRLKTDQPAEDFSEEFTTALRNKV